MMTTAILPRATFLLPLRILSTPNRREHWREVHHRLAAHRRVACHATQAYAQAVREHVAAGGTARVLLTRLAPEKMDGDNLAAACKGVRDGVADALGVTDAEGGPVEWRYAQERSSERAVRVEVRAR